MIQKLIDEALVQKPRERSGKISPSQLGRCHRAQYWYRKGELVTNPPNERTLRVFKVGNIFHKFVQDIIIKNEIAAVEVKIETEDIIGYADIVFKDEVIDLKTMHSKGFWHLEKSNKPIEEQKLTNILQCALYAKLLEKPKFRLVFISKDDLCIAEYGFATNKWIEAVDKELKTMRVYWAKERLPEAEPRAYNGKECSYCDFKDRCKEEENGSSSN